MVDQIYHLIVIDKYYINIIDRYYYIKSKKNEARLHIIDRIRLRSNTQRCIKTRTQLHTDPIAHGPDCAPTRLHTDRLRTDSIRHNSDRKNGENINR